MDIKNLTRGITLKHVAYAVLAFVVIKIIMKIAGIGKAVGKGIGIGAGAASEALTAPVTLPFKIFDALKKNTAKAAAEAQKKKEADTKVYLSNTAERVKRAKLLHTDFTRNKGVRVKFTKIAVSVPQIEVDRYGAIQKTGKYKMCSGTYARADLFLKDVTKDGQLLTLDVVKEVWYSVNPFDITLV